MCEYTHPTNLTKMSNSEKYILDVMSGKRKGFCASLLRGVLSLIEPVYRWGIQSRNRKYDSGKNTVRLPTKVISVGNLTAGGTGKTPVVQWMVEKLIEIGKTPAVLMRGYKSVDGVSDEQAMLDVALNAKVSNADSANIIVQANPDRYAGARDVLAKNPAVDVFVMDDGFQHRRLARDFDLVLISAVEPFGFGHVHPRGLLREPISSLSRAQAVLITHTNEVSTDVLQKITAEIRQHTVIPIFHCSHQQVAVRIDNTTHPMQWLAGKKVFAFCGIGNPDSFFRQLHKQKVALVGELSLEDHFAYKENTFAKINDAAKKAKADLLLTTEKDFAKLKRLKLTMPIGVVVMQVQFYNEDDAALLKLIVAQLDDVQKPAVFAGLSRKQSL